jgi:hypothetical protein
MAISSNSIIHYTKEIARLESIIKFKGFRISYCSEKVNTRGGQSYSFAIPMVSFCDIPITEYKKHFYHTKGRKIGYYGDYGIGLTKLWASKNGLNPVVYIDYNSFTGTGLRKCVEYFLNSKSSSLKVPISDNDIDELLQFALYAKNYQGELYIGGKLEEKKYKFYDEREWRFVPKRSDIKGNEILLDISKYESDKTRYNGAINDCFINFSLDDISYIIVNTESEIEQIIDLLQIETAKNDKLFKKLVTKIFTNEQVLNDF